MRDDADLLWDYARNRSNEAFTELVHRHIDLVYAAALPRVGNDVHLAEDVVQTVFSDLARKAATLQLRSSLAGWLYTSARFAASDVVRREQRRREREQEAHAMNQPGRNEPPLPDELEEIRPQLERAIDELKPADREAVLLRFFAQRRFGEIGVLLGLREDAAQKRVERALEQLRTLLARRGITSTTAALASQLGTHTAISAPPALAAKVSGAALTGLAASGGSAITLGAIQFMTATKITVSFAAVCGVLAIGYGVLQHAAASAARDELATVNQGHATLDQRLPELALRVGQAKNVNAILEKEIASQQSRVASRANAGLTAAAAVTPPIDGKAIMRANLPLAVEATRASMRLRFGPFFRSLNLAPAQIDEFHAVLTHGDTINGFVKTKATTPEEIARREGATIELRELESRLRTVLGDRGMRQWEDYQWTADLWTSVVNTVARGVYHTDTPLTPVQGDRLARVLLEASSWSERRGRVDLSSIKWDQAMPRAAEFLSPAQVAALEAQRLKTEFDHAYKKVTGLPSAPARLPGL